MILRRATKADSELLFAWRNDPGTFKFSRNAAPITKEEHKFWFDNPKCEIWIACVSSLPIGVVRFDAMRTGTFEVSITVAPDERGQGWGHEMLEMACDMKPGTLVAEIHKDNVASRRIFGRCGFATLSDRIDPPVQFYVYRRDPIETV